MDLASMFALSASFTIILINIFGLVKIYTKINNDLNTHYNEIEDLKKLKSSHEGLKSDFYKMRQHQGGMSQKVESLEKSKESMRNWLKEINETMQSLREDLHKQLEKSSDRQYQQIEKLRGEINELYRIGNTKG